MLDPSTLDYARGGGLVTVVTQDARTGAVLMVAHADREALERTIASGEMHYRSRTRGAWHKGATSGHTQRVVSLTADCDQDAVLARVLPNGPACHTNAVSCFGDEALGADALGVLDRTIGRRAAEGNAEALPPAAAGTPVPRSAADPAPATPASYTRRLLGDRNLRLKKLGEETAELVTALADGDRDRAVEEGLDLMYHALVALRGAGVTLDDLRGIAMKRAARRE